MTRSSFTVIDEHDAFEIEANIAGNRVTISRGTLAATLGWKLEDRGLCRGDACVPIAGVEGIVGPEGIDLVLLAERLGRPLALDLEHRVAALAAAAQDRGGALASLEAPDFTLPDLSGGMHSLSDHRGKKALLVAYASW
jgi:hypothetical protein